MVFYFKFTSRFGFTKCLLVFSLLSVPPSGFPFIFSQYCFRCRFLRQVHITTGLQQSLPVNHPRVQHLLHNRQSRRQETDERFTGYSYAKLLYIYIIIYIYIYIIIYSYYVQSGIACNNSYQSLNRLPVRLHGISSKTFLFNSQTKAEQSNYIAQLQVLSYYSFAISQFSSFNFITILLRCMYSTVTAKVYILTAWWI